MTIDTPGFRADVTVGDGRNLDEVIDAIAFAAKLSPDDHSAVAPEQAQVSMPSPVVRHDADDHDKHREMMKVMFGSMCDTLLDDAGKILAEERERREQMS
jgi:hypothetical protein